MTLLGKILLLMALALAEGLMKGIKGQLAAVVVARFECSPLRHITRPMQE